MINITVDGRFVEQIEPLTKEEMQEVLKRANFEYAQDRTYNPTLGEAIYNQLPSYIAYPIYGSDRDMYNIQDDDLAITMLLNLTEKI